VSCGFDRATPTVATPSPWPHPRDTLGDSLAVSDKRTHFGRAGEFFAMSELLLRGWNVAVPVVDVGDDVFVIDDRDKTTLRVQVKSSRVQPSQSTARPASVSFTLSRTQLSSIQEIELLYMLMIREEQTWRFFIVPRERLDQIHQLYLSKERAGRGRPPKTHDEAKTDGITLTITLGSDPTAWGTSFVEFEAWPKELPEILLGPGTVIG
jgi:hypothetical protein